jgi:hypothetical protein
MDYVQNCDNYTNQILEDFGVLILYPYILVYIYTYIYIYTRTYIYRVFKKIALQLWKLK